MNKKTADGERQSGPQIVYLDFDGGEMLYRNNDLGLTVDICMLDSGVSEAQQRYILSELTEKYTLDPVVFTLDKPAEDIPYSTVFVGFSDDILTLGSFAGLAETIDVNNQIRDDNAFVFMDHIDSAESLITVIAHETDHIFKGRAHAVETGELSDYALTVFNEDENNDKFEKANQIGTLNGDIQIKGSSLWHEIDNDFFLFTAGSSGTLTVSISNIFHYSLQLYDSSGRYLTGRTSVANPQFSYQLTQGNQYYLRVATSEVYKSRISYTVNVSFETAAPLPPAPPPAPVYKPDLELLWISAFGEQYEESHFSEDDIINIGMRVNNISTTNNAASCRAKITVGDLVRYVTIPALGIGEGKNLQLQIKGSELGPGTHKIFAVVDCDQVLSELSESNNASLGEVQIVIGDPAVDLKFSAPSGWRDKVIISTNKDTNAPGEITVEDTVYLDWSLTNAGDISNRREYLVELYLDGYLLKTWEQGVIQNGFHQSVLNYSLGKLSQGTHRLKLVIDPTDSVAESDESNNVFTKTFTVTAGGDRQAPTQPSNISFSEKNGTVYFDWSDSQDESGIAGYEFRYVRRNGFNPPDFTYSSVLETSVNSLTLSGLESGEYYYQIRSADTVGNYSAWTSSSWSFSVTNASDLPPAVPRGIHSGIVDDVLVLSWAPVSGTAGYQVRFESGKTGVAPQTFTVYSNSCTVNVPQRYAGWQIRSFNSAGKYSDWSEHCFYETWERSSQYLSSSMLFLDENSKRIVYSVDGFPGALTVKTDSWWVDTFALPQGTFRMGAYSLDPLAADEEKVIVSADPLTAPEKVISNGNGELDVFFGNAKGQWRGGYLAQHHGDFDGWNGTSEAVLLNGKNNISDVFSGSTDANILVLTDDACGDALFLEDTYTVLGNQARLSQIDEIRAGAGDDIIDLTSQLFAYKGNRMTIRGGDGNDVIWASDPGNDLFGDAGDDRIVGGADDDVIIGGIGNDSMHGGGGDDIFCFGNNWGNDTVEQLAGGSVTLWFENEGGSWDAAALTYTDGTNSVTVSGVSSVTLKFGADASLPDGCFADAASEKIFEDKNSGMLA